MSAVLQEITPFSHLLIFQAIPVLLLHIEAFVPAPLLAFWPLPFTSSFFQTSYLAVLFFIGLGQWARKSGHICFNEIMGVGRVLSM